MAKSTVPTVEEPAQQPQVSADEEGRQPLPMLKRELEAALSVGKGATALEPNPGEDTEEWIEVVGWDDEEELGQWELLHCDLQTSGGAHQVKACHS